MILDDAEATLIGEWKLSTHAPGYLDAGYFRNKFGVEILDRFGDAFGRFVEAGFVTVDGDRITLDRDALLQVDGMLPDFFLDPHRNPERYT